MKWKMILTEAENNESEKYKDQEQENCTAKARLEEDCMYISTGIDNLTTKYISKLAEPPPEQERKLRQPNPGYILAQNYRAPTADEQYVSVGPSSSNKSLYQAMVTAAVKLNQEYKGVKGMVSRVKMYTNNNNATIDDTSFSTHNGRNVITMNALFDGGADGGAFQQEHTSLIEPLEDKIISVGTAIGVQTKT